MRRVPDAWLFEPWRMPQVMQEHLKLTIGINDGKGSEFDIPKPLLDLQTPTREAKAKLFGLRAQSEVKAGKAAIVEKHASRANSGAKKPPSKSASRRKETTKFDDLQIALDF